ncbi:MAG: 50S ribosomal protein L21 [Candidatus Sungbacteria bacterium RIFCSPHIGHO2_01_FULL_50_25]|uniref:Large ribosomal subunit protein bL21 n=1 Tax=Candidatus Sungbacteria bacterium RIFCSPHIGHO2_01_FULL_50_25 TaxID=1802265 RepID=A0A1G2K7Q3_9BACT|nr:MAG: 50S ribosomal protein L21 [Candidatus Sungbacteria bacterium RIFCSPHIGHO2_01_FULL_50_25]
MWAVIRTGGKQYIVSPGKKLKIEKIDAAEGGNFVCTEVLLSVDDGDNIIIGTPTIPGASIHAKVLLHARARKVIVFKYRPKARWRKKKGHRQHYTEVEITGINTK